MNPFDGQRQLEVRAEQVVWHLVSAGVLGLLLLLLVVTVALLEGAQEATPPTEATPRVARPVESEAPVRAHLETSQRDEPAVPVVHPMGLTVRAVPPRDPVLARSAAFDTQTGEDIDA